MILHTPPRKRILNRERFFRDLKRGGIDLTYTEFKNIYNYLLKRMVEILVSGEVIAFPYEFGSVYVRKFPVRYVLDENGKLDRGKSSLPIDWKRTRDYWRANPEEKREKFFYHIPEYDFVAKVVWQPEKRFPKSSILRMQAGSVLKQAIKAKLDDEPEFILNYNG